MALIKCPECGKEISGQAPACPHCGYARPKVKVFKTGCLGVLIVLALFLGFGYFTNLENQARRNRTLETGSPEAIRQMKIREQFSPSTGVNYHLEVFLQNHLLKDPDSYKHYSTSYRDTGEYLLVKTRFRAKNSFGGFTAQWVEAMVTYDGDVLGIVGQGVE